MRFKHILTIFSYAAAVGAVSTVVDLSYSKYEGTALPGGVTQWLGIRYAEPPLGNLRFAAPITPHYNSTIQKADKHGFLCLADQLGPGLQYGKQPMDEDCLFLDVYAPTNATEHSRLPVMVFIQGGGFNANANGNFNGTLLVQNSGMKMIVITLNYRVGLLGSLASKEVLAGGSLNNGLKDVIFVLQWVQDRIDLFGGNIHHVVLSGDSAGANIIELLMAAHNGKGLPGYFHAAAAESPVMSSNTQVVDLQPHYNDLVKATGCSNQTETLSCLRAMNVTDLQTKSPAVGWFPCIDNDILVAPLYEMYEARKFRQVPTIFGSTTDEGTKNTAKWVDTTTLDLVIRGYLGNITNAQLAELKMIYPESLNNISFQGAVLASPYPGAGDEWQRLAALAGEIGIRCVGYFLSDMEAAAGNCQNWHYHYDVLDPRAAANGNRVYHTVELNAIWGYGNTDGNPPPSYGIPNDQGGDAGIVPIMQSYWISFVLTLNPNALRGKDLAQWDSWTLGTRRRLLFHNNGTAMESLTDAEKDRCKVAIQYSKAANSDKAPLTTLPPFANGTYPDPYH